MGAVPSSDVELIPILLIRLDALLQPFDRLFLSRRSAEVVHGPIGVVTVLALQEQLAPPTLRLDVAATDCTLDYIPHTPRPMMMTNVLSNTFGFGGSNVSLLFRASS